MTDWQVPADRPANLSLLAPAPVLAWDTWPAFLLTRADRSGGRQIIHCHHSQSPALPPHQAARASLDKAQSME